MVVGTHVDLLSSGTKSEVLSKLKSRFRELYVDGCSHTFSYPKINPSFIVVNCYESRNMDSLRNYIYDFAVSYKPPGTSFLSSLPFSLSPSLPPSLCCQCTPHTNREGSLHACHVPCTHAGPAHVVHDMPPLLEQPIPETYIQLQDMVRALTQKCNEHCKIPIYTRKDYM